MDYKLDKIKCKNYGSEENTTECYQRLGNYANRAGKAIKSKAKFVASSLLEAAKESLESHDIPAKKSYLKEHPIDVILTAAGLGSGAYTAASDAIILSDPSVFHNVFSHGKVPSGTTFIPPNNPQNYISSNPRITPLEPMNAGHYVSLALPFILFGLTIGGEYYRYNKWKKSIQKNEEPVKD